MSSLPYTVLFSLIFVNILMKNLIQADENVDKNNEVDEFRTFSAIHDEQDCPHLSDHMISGPQIPWGFPFRAFLTVPVGFQVKKSKIKNAGHGLFTNVFIKKFTWLGEYEGTPHPWCGTDKDNEDCDSFLAGCSYTFRIHKAGEKTMYVDAADVKTSNYLRWVNCATNSAELNIDVKECYGKILFQASKDISPGQELLVYYGDDYAESLDIDTTAFS